LQRSFELDGEGRRLLFNKSHSACYSLLAFQTAYLKAHYPRRTWPRS
jgi:DNA polymerase III alpha subunit (gram-positive type)